jgi:hypothetical protein
MGASRPFRQALKCGGQRIAPGERRSAAAGQFPAENDRDGSSLNELDAHPGAEHTSCDRNSLCRKGGAEAFGERPGELGRAAPEKLGRLPVVAAAVRVSPAITTADRRKPDDASSWAPH